MHKNYKRRHKRPKGYRSPLELEVSKSLPSGKFTFESEYLPYLLPKKYLPDFVVDVKGRKMYIEVKGYLRYEDQQKMKAVKYTNPELDIRFIFPKDGLINRPGKKVSTNSQWCEAHGFQYHIGTKVPKAWLK